MLGVAMIIAAVAGGWAQVRFRWTNDGVWLVIVAVGVLGLVAVLVSVFGSDYWGAVTLGRPDF